MMDDFIPRVTFRNVDDAFLVWEALMYFTTIMPDTMVPMHEPRVSELIDLVRDELIRVIRERSVE